MDALTIQPSLPLPLSEDYNFLRLKGIEAIEKLTGTIWTNYNDSDPGITLLEALCYALTDLAYRVSMPLEDLLAPADPRVNYWENNFYTARQILPSSPLTYTDLRKTLIDIDGVLNAWVERSYESEVLCYIDSTNSVLSYTPDNNQYLALKGLHKVYVEFEDAVLRERAETKVLNEVRAKLSHHRTLCEDIVEVAPVQYELFTLNAVFHLHEGSDLIALQAKVFLVVKNFFSPPVSFYSLDEMLGKGYTHDEIFEGPVLRHGFIDTAELERSSEFKLTHLSDLVNLLLDLDEIISITNFIIPEAQGLFKLDDFPNNDFAAWLYAMGLDRKIPKLDVLKCDLLYLRSGDRFRSSTEQRADMKLSLDMLNFLEGNQAHARLKGYHPDLAVPHGTFMNTAEYFPVQRTLPHCYNQHYSLIATQVKDIRAQFELLKALGPDKILPLQLKSYLMVFEQILANNFSQLSHLKELFSFDPGIRQTYFSQKPNEIFDLNYLFTISADHFFTHDLPAILEKPLLALDRRERFLDHLSAEYSEDLGRYSQLMHQHEGDQAAGSRLIVDKALMLQDYIAISNYRSRGLDYTDADKGYNSDNVSGFEKRLSRLLGIRDYKIRNLAIDYIKIHTITHENGVQRFSVKVIDPDDKDRVLLNSEEYEFQEEAEGILNYILKNGWNKTLYLDSFSQNRVAYNLQMATDEGDRETVAFKYVNVRERNQQEAEAMLKTDFDRLLTLLTRISANEGIHLVEHILLRPKIGPRHSAKKSTLDADLINFLPLRTVGALIDPAPMTIRAAYNFKINSTQQNLKTTWKISFKDEYGNEILVFDEAFTYYKHVLRRVTLVRQFGSDAPSYHKVLQKDGAFTLELWSVNHVLARGTGTYTETELNTLITTLVHYFALEAPGLSTQPDESDDDPYSYQLSLVIPDWPKRFQEAGFRHLLEQTIYLETPAHITVHVLWAGHGLMHDFEEAYRLWLEELSASPAPNAELVNNLIYELKVLNEANSALMAKNSFNPNEDN